MLATTSCRIPRQDRVIGGASSSSAPPRSYSGRKGFKLPESGPLDTYMRTSDFRCVKENYRVFSYIPTELKNPAKRFFYPPVSIFLPSQNPAESLLLPARP